MCRHGAPVKILSGQAQDFVAEVVMEDVYAFMKAKKIQGACTVHKPTGFTRVLMEQCARPCIPTPGATKQLGTKCCRFDA